MSATRRAGGHRERLLAAAVWCLRERGYSKTTARDLVEASDTNLASIGYHFGGKEALLNEAIAEGFRAWTAEVERTTFADERGTLLERFERSLAATVDRFAELRPFLVAFAEAFPQAVRDQDLREQMAAAYREAREAGAAMVSRALTESGGEISEENATTLASVVMALCDGLALQWLLEEGATPSSGEITSALWAAIATETSRSRARAAAPRRPAPGRR